MKIMRYIRFVIAALTFLPLMAFGQSKLWLDEGFYRIQNVYNNRYLALLDNTGYARINGSSIDADLFAIRSLNDTNKIMSNPATIIHLMKNGSGYVCSAQGTSTKAITSYAFTLSKYAKGTVISVEVSSYGKAILTEYDSQEEDKEVPGWYNTLPDSGLVGQTGSTAVKNRIYWKFTKVDALSSNYVGFAPTLSVDGRYYDTFYAEFPFKVVSSGVKVYSVYAIYDGKAVLKPFADGEIISGGTPVLVECSSSKDSSNKIAPQTTAVSALKQNQLKGIYFNYYCDQVSTKVHNNRTKYDASTMRVLGVSNGKLAFVTASDLTYLPANKAYLSVPTGTSDVLGVMSYSEYEKLNPSAISHVTVDTNNNQSGTYTLEGKKVSKITRSGVYIVGGKKLVVRK